MNVSTTRSAYQKMGYHDAYELGPAEVVKITKDGW